MRMRMLGRLVGVLLSCSVVIVISDQSFNFHTGSFFSSDKFQGSQSRYPTAKPASYPASSYTPGPPSYSTSPPKYSPPTKYPKPAPYKPKYPVHQPTHNCTVQDETVLAEVCTPSFIPTCGPVTLKGTKVGSRQKCLKITRTVCTQSTEETTVTLCTIGYGSKPEKAQATTVDVSFQRECAKQMVTVCEPQYQQQSYGYQKGSYQHCKEIGQETCYNKPEVKPRQTQVDVKVPVPKQNCQPMRVELPTVECEDIEEERCVPLPALEPADVQAEQCTVDVGPPECRNVELVLPKQVCQEVIYGHASKANENPGYSS